MKSIAITLLICGFLMDANAQLTDTKWKNIMNIPQPTECILQFKKDTLLLLVAADGSLVETMKYTIAKDTFKLYKLSGLSPCSEDIVGLYIFAIKDDKMTITPSSDDCSDRAEAFKPEAWIREKS